MRESIGGTMLFWIVLFLFSIFIIFIAFIIKYARVYKIKNSMINYIERNEGVVSQLDFENRLKSYSYQEGGTYKICRYFPNDVGGYYYLELYSVSQFPIIGNIAAISVTIKGETKTISTGTKIKNVDNWFNSLKDECKFCILSPGAGTGRCSNVDPE